MNDSERRAMRQAKLLIGQQLLDLEKLETLHEYLSHVLRGTVEDFIREKSVSAEQLNDIVTELREKVNELLMTPYATELLLVILPSLLDAKKAQ